MEANIKYTISNEDLVGVLRTILMFLENLGFKNTCDALQNDCIRKGYDVVKSDPAKLVLITPSEVEEKKECVESCKIGKTDKCTCLRESSSIKSLKDQSSKKCQCSQTLSSNNLKGSACPKLYSDDYVPPATMESEQPTKILSKSNLNKIHKNFENEKKLVNRSHSTPSIKANESFMTSVENEEMKEKIEKAERYRQLQNERENSKGTITELSQTMILGSPETNQPIIITSLSTTGKNINGIKSTQINQSGTNMRIVSKHQISSATDANDLDDIVEKHVSLKISTISKINSKTAVSNIYIVDNNVPKEKDKSSVLNVSEQTSSTITDINTQVHCESPRSVTNIYEEHLKREEPTKLHKCMPCNQLPNIFVDEDKDKIESEYNIKNTSTDLDFKKIKKDLCNGDDNLKLQLVQALRWRITQNDSTTRYKVMGSYIRHDVLGLCGHSIPTEKSVPKLYLCPDKITPNPLQEQMARLLNTFASLTFGRDYLCQDDVVSLLVSLIIDNQALKVSIDSKTRDMLIATLQKLSLRNQQRMLMISSGLLEYLVSFLKTQHRNISKYCMEYSTALFMNLCLHKEARNRLVPHANEVISLLSELLDVKYYYCMPYVNGAIYSLLLNPHINKEAQRLKLDKLIEYHIQNTEGEMRRQLKVILKLHKNESAEDDCDCDPSVEPEEEGDYLEPELDSEDSFKLQPSGDDLLEKYKILFSVFGSQVYAVRLKCMCAITNSSRPCSQPIIQKDIRSIENNENDSQMMENLHKSSDVKSNPKDSRMLETLDKSSGVKNNQKDSQTMENISKSSTKYVTEHKPIKLNTLTTLQNNDNKTSLLTSLEMYFKEESEQLSPVPSSHTEIVESKQKTSKPKAPEKQSAKQNAGQAIPYNAPSAKTKIFDSKRYHDLYNPPPSFTRTIPTKSKMLTRCVDRCPTYCYKQRISESDRDSNRFLTCYRESYDNCMVENFIPSNEHQCKPDCVCCNTRRKYSCNCYNDIRKSINIDDTNMKDNVKLDLPKAAASGCHCTCVQAPEPMKAFINSTEESAPPITPTTQHTQHDRSSVVDFSYNELLCNLCPETTICHVCPKSKVNLHCYDDVFLSRPRILRTPP